MNKLSPQEEIILLRKKARRRLVGTIALVAVASAILWKTLDKPVKISSMQTVQVIQENMPASVPVIVISPPSQVASDPLSVASVPLPSRPDVLTNHKITSTSVDSSAVSSKQANLPPLKVKKRKQKSKLKVYYQKRKTIKLNAELAKERSAATKKLAEEQRKAEEVLKAEEKPSAVSEHKKQEPNPENILNGH